MGHARLPSELTLATLRKPIKRTSLKYAATQDMLLDLVQEALKTKLPWGMGSDPGEMWGEAVGDAVFDSYVLLRSTHK